MRRPSVPSNARQRNSKIRFPLPITAENASDKGRLRRSLFVCRLFTSSHNIKQTFGCRNTPVQVLSVLSAEIFCDSFSTFLTPHDVSYTLFTLKKALFSTTTSAIIRSAKPNQ
jgi:hypothetical protein